MRLAILVAVLAAALSVGAHAAPSELCRSAARAAARTHGVPPAVMLAITEVETGTSRGGQRGPWPWTLNIEGEGRWFDTRAEALAAARRAVAAGRVSTDLGCFQVNHRWHGSEFASLDEMLDPRVSGDYAARFLADLAAEAGDWMIAAGWYHSRTPKHAARYRALIARRLEGGPRLAGQPSDRPALARAARRLRSPAGPARAAAPGAVALTLLRPARGALLDPAERLAGRRAP